MVKGFVMDDERLKNLMGDQNPLMNYLLVLEILGHPRKDSTKNLGIFLP